MYQIITKKWGLTPAGKPVRLPVLICDSDDDELPADLPIGSECTSAAGKTRLYFGDGAWVEVKNSAAIDDGETSEDSCWSSAKTAAALDAKANAVGASPALIAGGAQSLISSSAVGRNYFRDAVNHGDKTAGGVALIRRLLGNTACIRQLLPSENVSSETSGVSFTVSEDGRIAVSTAQGGATADAVFTVNVNTPVTGVGGHKYLLRGCPGGGSAATYSLGNDTGSGYVFTAASAAGMSFAITVKAGTEIDDELIFEPQLYDLTAAFGAGIEPDAEVFSLYQPEYMPGYRATMLNFNAKGLHSVGFNAFDGEKARVIKANAVNNGYQIKGSYSQAYFCPVDDEEEEWTVLLPESYTTSVGRIVTRILPPADGYVFLTGTDTSTGLSLIYDGRRAYENACFHAESTIPLGIERYFPGGMRSVGTFRDELNANEAISRIGVYDLGNAVWNTTAGNKYYTDSLKTQVLGANYGGKIEFDLLPTVSYSTFINTTSPSVALTNDGRIWACDLHGYTGEQFKNYVRGHTFHYTRKKASSQPVKSPLTFAYPVEELGLEEMVYEQPGAAAYCDVCYAMDVVGKFQSLDYDFINVTSMENFLAELSAQTGIDTDMYDDGGEYGFDIVAGDRMLPLCTASDAGKTVKVNASGTGYILA